MIIEILSFFSLPRNITLLEFFLQSFDFKIRRNIESLVFTSTNCVQDVCVPVVALILNSRVLIFLVRVQNPAGPHVLRGAHWRGCILNWVCVQLGWSQKKSRLETILLNVRIVAAAELVVVDRTFLLVILAC